MPTKDPERKKIQRRNYYYRKSKIINKKKVNGKYLFSIDVNDNNQKFDSSNNILAPLIE